MIVIPSSGPTLRTLSTREKRLLAACGASVLAFALYMAMPGAEEPAAVELAAAPAVPPPASPFPAAPQSALPQPAPAPASAVSADGLVLKGVSGGGPRGGSAFVQLPSGQQRVVPIGREALPGLTLKAVGISHAILGGTGGDIRLDLGRAGATPVGGAGGAGAAPAAAAAQANVQRETIGYRLGLQPVRQGGRTAGYAVKPGARMPRLEQAGLQPGDVIVAVNGSRFDEERMMELAWQASNSDRTEIEFVRGGRRMKASLGNGR